ncbi:developmentally-regulated protein [Acrasis kona]|uniref:Developmentally-regulated protein n=1 Tax=Acrasis kona TaxID=1008807 RepID=A0AAW2ZQW4_9EUKA
MSQPDNDSEQVDLQASKQVYEDAGKELERKKRKFAGEYKTEKCVLCQEMITEREAYSHTKLCLDDYELVFQLGSYSPNAKEAILQSASQLQISIRRGRPSHLCQVTMTKLMLR